MRERERERTRLYVNTNIRKGVGDVCPPAFGAITRFGAGVPAFDAASFDAASFDAASFEAASLGAVSFTPTSFGAGTHVCVSPW